jgi:hypothetical protein
LYAELHWVGDVLVEREFGDEVYGQALVQDDRVYVHGQTGLRGMAFVNMKTHEILCLRANISSFRSQELGGAGRVVSVIFGGTIVPYEPEQARKWFEKDVSRHTSQCRSGFGGRRANGAG